MESFLKITITGGLLGVFLSTLLLNLFPQVWYLIKFPVCFLHEICHFLVALVLQGLPSFPSFIIKFEGRQLILGSVKCNRITSLNAFPIGIAPLLVWLIPFYLFKTGTHPFLVFAVSVYLSPEGLPSGQDLKVALFSGSALVWGFLLLLTWLSFPSLLEWFSRIKSEIFVF